MREKKKSNGALKCRRIREIQQREEGKQSALSKEKAAATCEEREKKRTLGSLNFDIMPQKCWKCRNGGAEKERERGGEAKTVGAVFKLGKTVA